MNTPDLLVNDPHQSTLRLLPWYLNNTLATDEQKQVEQHLRTCLPCRQELNFLHKMAAATKQTSDLDIAADASFANLRMKLRSTTPSSPPPLRQVWPFPSAHHSPKRQSAKWRHLGLPLAMAAALLLALIPLDTHDWHAPPPADYHTLSATQPAPVEGVKLHVVFEERLEKTRIDALLASIHGQQLDGPNSAGAYTIRLSSNPNSPDRVAALTLLRQQPEVLLAEPIIDP